MSYRRKPVSSYFKKLNERWAPVFTGMTTFYENYQVCMLTMNLKELSSPIRMYWDVGSGALHEADCRRIADEIAASKILTLQITATSAAVSPSCLAILDSLKNKNVALSLVLPLSAWNQYAHSAVRDFSVRLLLISASLLVELESILLVQKQLAGKPAFGLAFSVTRDNYHDLPKVLKFCIDNQIQHLVLPMQRLIGSEEVFSFSTEERKELTSHLSTIRRPSTLKITIHDPFLWRAFFPSIEFPDGGCQAANTLLYISPDADVYPCPTLPVKIGSLKQMSLKDVIASAIKKEIGKNILTMPADCNGCEEVKWCKGGCRGRAYALKNSFSTNDPACR